MDLNAPWEAFIPDYDRPPLGLEKSDTPRNQLRRVDHEWIDTELLKQWLSDCLTQHASECGSEGDGDEYLSRILLVDTRNKCLVQKDSSCRYLALSYVWGSANAFLTTTDNIERLLEPGALIDLQLPKLLNRSFSWSPSSVSSISGLMLLHHSGQ